MADKRVYFSLGWFVVGVVSLIVAAIAATYADTTLFRCFGLLAAVFSPIALTSYKRQRLGTDSTTGDNYSTAMASLGIQVFAGFAGATIYLWYLWYVLAAGDN